MVIFLTLSISTDTALNLESRIQIVEAFHPAMRLPQTSFSDTSAGVVRPRNLSRPNRTGGLYGDLISWAAGAVILFATIGLVSAGTLAFDFDGGVGPHFSIANSRNLWVVATNGPSFRITKPADDGTVDPNGFISASILSRFKMTGDFLVTVDFSLQVFPTAGPHPNALNESVFSVVGSTNGEVFLVLRFRDGNTDQLEVYGAPGPVGAHPTSGTGGRYQIERVGDVLTGRIAPPNSSVFTTIGSIAGYTSPQFQIQLSGVQGFNVLGIPRSSTALDIAFDNLAVAADGFVAATPPQIQNVALKPGDVVVSGTNGLQGAGYRVLTSTDVTLPRTNWTRLATNTFGPGGSFSFTNTFNPGTPQRFYLIELPQ